MTNETFREWDDLTELEQAAIMYSDMYKDSYGTRPRGDFPATLEEYEQEFKVLSAVITENAREQELYEQEQIVEFEKSLDRAVEAGAKDRDEALRWLIQASEEEFRGPLDVDFFVYDLGFLFTEYGRNLVEKINAMMEPTND